MVRTPFRLALGLAAAALGFAGSAPLAAEEGLAWTASAGEGRCELRRAGDGTLSFAITYLKNGTYVLDGEAFANADGTGMVDGEIRILAEGGNVLLNGDPKALQAQGARTREHPVSLFLTANEGGTSFTVATEAGLKVVPLAGYEEPAAAFRDCGRSLMLDFGPRPPVAIAFDGLDQLAAAAGRQRLLSEVIGFTLDVDAEGRATDCELSRKFQRKIVMLEICRPLMEYHRFDPARDAEGKPVPGRYSSQIDFNMWMTQQGNIEAEDR